MPDRDTFSEVRVDVGAGRQTETDAFALPRVDTPFCVALLGDFGARGAAGAGERPPLAARRALLVDRDDLDAALARLAPTLALDLGDGAGDDAPVRVRFDCLDDFHPDRLYARLPHFAALRETRRRLADPRTFAAAATELQEPDGGGAATRTAAPNTAPVAGLLDQILADAPDDSPAPDDSGDLAAFIRRAVRPYLVPRPDPRQAELLASVDAAITGQLRALLHHADFQALEALWRGVDLLVRRVETGAALRLALFDVTRAELAADLAAATSARDSGVHRMLVTAGAALPEPAPWSLLAGLYTFGAADDDLGSLGNLAALGAGAGAPWLSAAHPRLAGRDDLAPHSREQVAPRDDAAWHRLRQSPHARSLGLVLPRMLLRLPYGAAAEPCDTLAFEEIAPDADASAVHAQLLWGNPVLAATLVLTEAFIAGGWAMHPGAHLDVTGLPLYLRRAAGSTAATPCAETLLTDDDMLRLLDAGVMPLLSRRDSDTVRLARLQSVAAPAAALAARWER